jgi:hypothetical protein
MDLSKNDSILLNVTQNAAYTLMLQNPLQSPQTLHDINIIDETNAESKVRYAISYSFDKIEWTPYSSDFLAAISQITIYSTTVQNDVYVKFKVMTTFDVDVDYLKIFDIAIDDNVIPHNEILISELTYFRGITNSYTKNLLKPYDNLDVSIDRMLAQAKSINDIFGHYVFFVKVSERNDSLNSTFKEYEKYYVSAIKKSKLFSVK